MQPNAVMPVSMRHLGCPISSGVSRCKYLNFLSLLPQTFMFAVFDDASESVQNATGPIDDGYIANAVSSLPGDPFCCAGPEPEMDGGMFHSCSNLTAVNVLQPSHSCGCFTKRCAPCVVICTTTMPAEHTSHLSKKFHVHIHVSAMATGRLPACVNIAAYRQRCLVLVS